MTWNRLEKICTEAELLVEERRPQLARHLPEKLKWNLDLVSKKTIESLPKTKELNQWSLGFVALCKPRGSSFDIVIANDLETEEEYLLALVHEILHACLFFKGFRNWNNEDVVERMTQRIMILP
jgi:hypothetical protein